MIVNKGRVIEGTTNVLLNLVRNLDGNFITKAGIATITSTTYDRITRVEIESSNIDKNTAVQDTVQTTMTEMPEGWNLKVTLTPAHARRGDLWNETVILFTNGQVEKVLWDLECIPAYGQDGESAS